MRNKCHVPDCREQAAYEVFLYDVYLHGEDHVFFERDFTCPFLCSGHMLDNEVGAQGTREPRGHVCYPYTNRDGAQGFTIYRPLARGEGFAEASETTGSFATILQRVRDLARANLSCRRIPRGPVTPAQQALRALLRSLEPGELYALLTFADLGRGPWRNPPDLDDLCQRQRRTFTPSQAIASLLDREELGKHLDQALEELRSRRSASA